MQTKHMARRSCDTCQGPWTTTGAQCSARMSLHVEHAHGQLPPATLSEAYHSMPSLLLTRAGTSSSPHHTWVNPELLGNEAKCDGSCEAVQ